jgi:hypothetical protein
VFENRVAMTNRKEHGPSEKITSRSINSSSGGSNSPLAEPTADKLRKSGYY